MPVYFPAQGKVLPGRLRELTSQGYTERVNVHKLQHKKFWNEQKDKNFLPLKTAQKTCLERGEKKFE